MESKWVGKTNRKCRKHGWNLLDASAGSTDEGEFLLPDSSDGTSDLGFFSNTEDGTGDTSFKIDPRWFYHRCKDWWNGCVKTYRCITSIGGASLTGLTGAGQYE